MTKNEALDLLQGMIDRVYEAGTFNERINLFHRLNGLYNQVVSYKRSSDYYALAVKEAEMLVSEVEVSLGG